MGATSVRTSASERILDILLMFGQAPGTLSVQDVAAAFGGSRSSTYRDLQTLRKRQLIEEVAVPGHFRLGAAAIALARGALQAPNLTAIAEPVMRALAAATRESVLLSRRADDRVAVIAAIDSPQALRVATEAARDLPMPVGSFGKIHMAWLRDAELDALLRGRRPKLDTAALRDELQAIRRQGYARSDGEVEPGMASLTVPIVTGGDTLLAALTLAAPSFRLGKPVVRRVLPMLRDAAARIAETWSAEPAVLAQRASGR